MKIAFVVRNIENIGIEYLSAVLRKNGHDVALIFDPALFENFYFYNKFFARCLSYKNIIIEEIKHAKADLIGFSILSDEFLWSLSIAEAIKKELKNTPIIFGGIHPSSVPELVIKEDAVDYVCIGEGEEPVVELVDALEQGKSHLTIENIWSKNNGEVVRNPIRKLNENLDILPFPDKDIFYNKYPFFARQTYKTITARGCPNACSYCYNSYFRKLYQGRGKYLRRRSVDNVISELLLAKNKYKINRVTFLDDTFIYNHNWLKEFIFKYKEKIDLPFGCTVHPSFVSKEIVKLLEYGGCTCVNMGIQDLNENLRKDILNRKDTNIEIKRSIRLIKKSSIFMYTTVIFGLPLQKEKEMIEIVSFLNKYRPDIPDSNWLRYYPKTSIVDFALAYNFLTSEKVAEINKSREFRPYALGGHTFNLKALRFRNLLLLTCLLPKKIIEAIIRKKLYYLIPPIDMRPFVLVIVFIYHKLSRKRKHIYPVSSVYDIFVYHLYFVTKKLSYFFLKNRIVDCKNTNLYKKCKV